MQRNYLIFTITLLFCLAISNQAIAVSKKETSLKKDRMGQRLQREMKYLEARANSPKVWGRRWNVKKKRSAEVAQKSEGLNLESAFENSNEGFTESDSVSTRMASPIKQQEVDKDYKRKSRAR